MNDASHDAFITAYRAGRLRVRVWVRVRVRVRVDRKRAARFVSGRLLLPFFLLPLAGVAVAPALAGFLVAGIALLAAVWLLRLFVRASSRGCVLSRALEQPGFYRDAVEAEVLRVEGTGEDSRRAGADGSAENLR